MLRNKDNNNDKKKKKRAYYIHTKMIGDSLRGPGWLVHLMSQMIYPDCRNSNFEQCLRL